MTSRSKKVYVGTAVAGILIAGGLVTFLVVGPDRDTSEAGTNDVKQVTSAIPGYRGYSVTKTWFDHPGLESTKPGDLDGDGKTAPEEKKAVEKAKELSDQVVTKVAPAGGKRVSSSLLTPATDDWWMFVTSQTDTLRLWHWDAPKKANWFAVTWSQENAGPRDDRISYPLVHIAFESTDEMIGWVNSRDFSNTEVTPTYRGAVLTLVPPAVDPSKQELSDDLADLAGTKQETGYWNIDFAKQVAYDALESPEPDSYELFWRAAGFTDETFWSAASDTPARWVGKISGWDRKNLSIEMAAWAVNRTANDETPGLTSASGELYLGDMRSGVGFGASSLKPKTTPEGADMVMSFTEQARAQMTRLNGVMGSVTGVSARWIKDDTMVIEQWLGTPPAGETIDPEDIPGVNEVPES